MRYALALALGGVCLAGAACRPYGWVTPPKPGVNYGTTPDTPNYADNGTLPNPEQATVTVTTCTDNFAGGTITNTGNITNSFLVTVSVYAGGGGFEAASSTAEVGNLPAGHTASWGTPVTFAIAPTYPVTCTVSDVLPNN